MEKTAAIDGPLGRVVAAGVLATAIGALMWIHWDDLFPPQAQVVDANDPFSICFSQRAADIDGMVADGVIGAAQADSFKARAEALCRAQTSE